jgi:hypothetical protein
MMLNHLGGGPGGIEHFYPVLSAWDDLHTSGFQV